VKRLWRDTLFKRLFVLMWVALVVSHLIAYTVVMNWVTSGRGASPGFSLADAPVLPSLPPTPGLPGGPPMGGANRPPLPPGDMLDSGPFPGSNAFPPDGDAGGPDGVTRGAFRLPTGALLLDYGVRCIIIGAAAWFGARWVSAPMRRLVDASHSLAASIGGQGARPELDERRGSVEVREAAHVFNQMARQLEEQFKGRGLLVAAISHDLRTPLTRVRMRLESFEAEPAAQRCIADVREMNELIDSSLELFRGAGISASTQAVDVQALVQSLCDDIVEQGHIATASGHAAVVDAQPAALRRTLSNLVSNAVRYGGRADVSVFSDPSGVRILVDDDGPGIPPAQMDAVFQPFYRVESSRNRHTGGTGLGLYIARDLIARQGGTVSLANRSEGGLRATVFVPRRR
jgi:signal transduction histidine kinase